METFAEYEREVGRTKGNGRPREMLVCWALGIAGEGGEFADAVKKREFHGVPTETERLLEELGDDLWYITAAALELGSSLDEVVAMNVAKLRRRYPDGFVRGGGVR